MVLSFLLKQESRLFDDPGFRIKCGMTGLTVQLTEHDLKKQSQFQTVKKDISFYYEGDYEEKCICWLRENKANQSQFQTGCPLMGRRKYK